MNEEKATNRLNKIKQQIENVQTRIEQYNEWCDKNFHSKYDELSEQERGKIRKHICETIPWDFLNEKKEKLENEWYSLYRKLQSYRFEKYGWVVYESQTKKNR